jgi:flagellar assembly factor FliW
MPAIKINGKDHQYDDDQVIEFAEGLIGMPRLRRAALVEMKEYAPFCWLASLDNDEVRFVVVDPNEIFADYKPAVSDKDPALWTIVKVSSDWKKTTVNLRAPICVDRATKTGTQLILADTSYKMEEGLPTN